MCVFLSPVIEVTQGCHVSGNGREVWRKDARGWGRERGRNLAEANEASLTVANWCFNLWLRLSWCFSLPAGRLMGIRAEQTFCPPMFIFTYPKEKKKKKRQYLSSAGLRGASQTALISPSQCQNLGEVNGGELEEERNRRQKRAAGGRDGGEGSVLGEDERGLSLHHNDSVPFSSRARQTLDKCKWRSRLQIDFWSLLQAGGPISTAEWFDRWFGRPINELPRHRNIKDERLFT